MKKLLALLLLSSTAFGAGTTDNKYSLGDAQGSDKFIIFNKGSGSGNPKLRWNDTKSKLQFSNDGTNYKDIGAGTGNGSGINLLTNGNFEDNLTDWSASGGTLTLATSGSDFSGEGEGSGKWDYTASGQTLSYASVEVKNIVKENYCALYFYYKGSAAAESDQVVAEVTDGTNSLGFLSLPPRTNFGPAIVPFNCPDSGNLVAQFKSPTSGASGTFDLDNVQLGTNPLIGQVTKQAQIYGGVKYIGVAGCSWSNGSTGTFSADNDCNTPTATGNASIPTTKIPGIRFANGFPAGDYVFHVIGDIACNRISNNCFSQYSITDGTNRSSKVNIGHSATGSTAASHSNPVVTFRMSYASAVSSDTTFQMYVENPAGGTADIQTSATSDFEIIVEYFPKAQSDVAISPIVNAWRVDANISGANIDLGTSSVSSYTEMTNASLTLTNNTGKNVLTAQIPCSSTNPSSGTTCSAGSESNGVVFNLPTAGDVLACASFAHRVNFSSASLSIDATFQIVETPNNAQTILQEGKSRVASTIGNAGAAGNQDNKHPLRVCGTFSFQSSGQKTLRLMYEQTATAVGNNEVTGDASASNGQRDIHWEVYPLTQNVVNPLLVPAPSAWRVDANIAGANIALGTSAVSSYAEMTNGSLTLTNNSGNGTIAAEIACASGTASTGTTCSVNESNGIAFTIPSGAPLDVEACASFSHLIQSASSQVDVAFQINETNNSDTTILQNGKTRLYSRTGGGVAGDENGNPITLCGTFSFSSAGKKTLRVMYEQLANSAGTNNVIADGVSTIGERDIHWTVRPIQSFNVTQNGNVTSNTTGLERIERAYLNCDGSSSIISQSGTWITTNGNISSGVCNWTISGGIFSSAPACVVSGGAGNDYVKVNAAPTSTTLQTYAGSIATATASAGYDFSVICMGPR